mgnify:CR=1 FL=1
MSQVLPGVQQEQDHRVVHHVQLVTLSNTHNHNGIHRLVPIDYTSIFSFNAFLSQWYCFIVAFEKKNHHNVILSLINILPVHKILNVSFEDR